MKIRRLSHQGYQVLLKKSAETLVVAGMLALCSVVSGQAQSAKNQSENSVANEINPARLMQSSIRPLPALRNQSEESLASGNQNLMSSSRGNLAAAMQGARLPPASGKKFSSVEFSESLLLS